MALRPGEKKIFGARNFYTVECKLTPCCACACSACLRCAHLPCCSCPCCACPRCALSCWSCGVLVQRSSTSCGARRHCIPVDPGDLPCPLPFPHSQSHMPALVMHCSSLFAPFLACVVPPFCPIPCLCCFYMLASCGLRVPAVYALVVHVCVVRA